MLDRDQRVRRLELGDQLVDDLRFRIERYCQYSISTAALGW